MLNSIVGLLDSGAGGGGGAYESIATASGNGVATITFSSIPSTYKHLQVRGTARHSAAVSDIGDIQYLINGDTTSSYAQHYLFGNGSSASSVGQSAIANGNIRNALCYDADTANTFGSFILDIHDYASTTKNKTARYFSGVDTNGTGRTTLGSTLWINTSAITSLTFRTGGANFVNGTVFSLYGIK